MNEDDSVDYCLCQLAMYVATKTIYIPSILCYKLQVPMSADSSSLGCKE